MIPLPGVVAASCFTAAAAVRLACARHDAAAARRRLGSSRWQSAAERVALADPAGPPVGGWFERRRESAAVPVGASSLRNLCAALAAGGLVAGGLAGGAVLAGIGAALGVAAVPIALVAASGRSDERAEAAMPAVLDSVSRSLRTGASLSQAMAEAAAEAPAAVAPDLRRVVADATAGAALVESLDAWAERRPIPGVRLAVGALALGAETGGARAQAVDGVAATLRARLAVAGEVKAMASQARLSALVIAAAPLAFAVLAASADERTTGFLLRTPLGQLCLAAGIILDLAGALWMQRLCRIQP